MPTYQYRCTDCGRELEVVQKFTDASLTQCPSCQGSLRKVFNAVGVVFKGSGFYRTDSRSAPSGEDGSPAKVDGTKTEATKTDSTKTDSTKGSSTEGAATTGSPAKDAPATNGKSATAERAGSGTSPSGGSGSAASAAKQRAGAGQSG